MIAAGKLTHRMELQVAESSPNTFGEAAKGWYTYATIWTAVRPVSTRESLAAQQVNSKVTHHIRIRHRLDVAPTHRLLMGGRVFEINGVRNVDEAGVETILDCTETKSIGRAFGEGTFGEGTFGDEPLVEAGSAFGDGVFGEEVFV